MRAHTHTHAHSHTWPWNVYINISQMCMIFYEVAVIGDRTSYTPAYVRRWRWRSEYCFEKITIKFDGRMKVETFMRKRLKGYNLKRHTGFRWENYYSSSSPSTRLFANFHHLEAFSGNSLDWLTSNKMILRRDGVTPTHIKQPNFN